MKMSNEGWKIFDTESATDYQTLIAQSPTLGAKEVWERDRKQYGYGSFDLELEYGIPAMEACANRPTMLQPDQYEEAVAYALEHRVMPMFYTYKWRPKGFRYSQANLGYCWTFGGTGGMLTCRAIEDKPLVYLVPVSMGYLVGWANRGNFLASWIKGAREDGIYPGRDRNALNDLTRDPGKWPFDDLRKAFRLDEVWDLDPDRMVQHCLTCLCAGRSVYIAYNWWGHALELVGVRYVNGELQWIISNSHNEDDFIILTGRRARPDEAIGIVSTKSVALPDGYRFTEAGLFVPEGIAL